MSTRKIAKKSNGRRRAAAPAAKGTGWRPPAVCPEPLHPVVAVIAERVDALKRLLKNPGITPRASRELVGVVKELEQCKARVMRACAKGSPPYYAPSRF
ncbi:MAG: hypothetical protein ACRD2X_16315 [Vicinamibacteraceae bacterium]